LYSILWIRGSYSLNGLMWRSLKIWHHTFFHFFVLVGTLTRGLQFVHVFIYKKQKTIEQKHNQKTKNKYVISKSRQGILYMCYTIFQIFEKPRNNACVILNIINYENNHDYIIDPTELQFLPNNQYMGPYIFIHVVFNCF
jgi:hypothetical protein